MMYLEEKAEEDTLIKRMRNSSWLFPGVLTYVLIMV